MATSAASCGILGSFSGEIPQHVGYRSPRAIPHAVSAGERQATPLSHITIQGAKPKAKPFKLAGGDGLFLVIQPNGGKLRRYRHRFRGAERSLSIGPSPKVTIAEARAARTSQGLDHGRKRSLRSETARPHRQRRRRATRSASSPTRIASGSRRTARRLRRRKRTADVAASSPGRSRVARSPGPARRSPRRSNSAASCGRSTPSSATRRTARSLAFSAANCATRAQSPSTRSSKPSDRRVLVDAGRKAGNERWRHA